MMAGMATHLDPNAIDPKLERAKEDIKAVLDRYDLNGTICLVSKTHASWFLHFRPWVGLLNQKGSVRLRLKSGDGKLDQTGGLIHYMQDLTYRACHTFTALRQTFEDKVAALDGPGIGLQKITPDPLD